MWRTASNATFPPRAPSPLPFHETLQDPKLIVLEFLGSEFIDHLRERKRRSTFGDEMDALCRLCHQLATGVEYGHPPHFFWITSAFPRC